MKTTAEVKNHQSVQPCGRPCGSPTQPPARYRIRTHALVTALLPYSVRMTRMLPKHRDQPGPQRVHLAGGGAHPSRTTLRP